MDCCRGKSKSIIGKCLFILMFIKEVEDIQNQLYKIDEKDEKLHSYVDNVIEYIVIGIWDDQMSYLGRYL